MTTLMIYESRHEANFSTPKMYKYFIIDHRRAYTQSYEIFHENDLHLEAFRHHFEIGISFQLCVNIIVNTFYNIYENIEDDVHIKVVPEDEIDAVRHLLQIIQVVSRTVSAGFVRVTERAEIFKYILTLFIARYRHLASVQKSAHPPFPVQRSDAAGRPPVRGRHVTARRNSVIGAESGLSRYEKDTLSAVSGEPSL